LISGAATIDTLNDTSLVKQAEKININEFNRILYVELNESGKDKVLEAISVFEDLPEVIYAGPDYEISAFSIPNDTYYSGEDTWPAEKIGLPAAWNISTGSSSISIGVIDTGIDGTHPDLINRINTNLCRDYITGEEIAVSPPIDPVGHGTHVAGIIGAQGNNAQGISGVCWNVSLVSLRVLDSAKRGYSSYLVDAIDFATDNGIDILNASLGWDFDSSYYNMPVYTAISNYPGLFVCAAGNDIKDTDQNYVYPNSYILPNLISVGATTSADEKHIKSNYGQVTVDLFAPGHDLLSCYPLDLCAAHRTTSRHKDTGYHYSTGTSMAAPLVAGVAALLLSKYPNMTPYQIKSTILANVDKVSNLSTYCTSGGRLNAYKALSNPITHTHIFNYQNYGDLTYHKATCSLCNYVEYEKHSWEYTQINPYVINPQYIPQYECTKCGIISLTEPTLY